MSEQALSSLTRLFIALSDKTRLRLLGLMADGEVSVGYLVRELGESQPKISRHLAYLRSTGVVSTRREGKWMYYGIAAQPDVAAAMVLSATLKSMLDEQCPQITGSNESVRPGEPSQSARTELGTVLEAAQPAAAYDSRQDQMEVFLL